MKVQGLIKLFIYIVKWERNDMSIKECHCCLWSRLTKVEFVLWNSKKIRIDFVFWKNKMCKKIWKGFYDSWSDKNLQEKKNLFENIDLDPRILQNWFVYGQSYDFRTWPVNKHRKTQKSNFRKEENVQKESNKIKQTLDTPPDTITTRCQPYRHKGSTTGD